MTDDLTGKEPSKPRTSLGWVGLFGALLLIVFLVGGVFLSYETHINSAVIASGKAVVRGKPKAIQHLDGGIVSFIHVKNGDLVENGKLLVTLDDTILTANIGIYKSRLADALALRDRLLAEQIGSENIDFASDSELLAGVERNAAWRGQQAIFESRTSVREARKERLREKIRQFGHQKEGIQLLISSKREQLDLIVQEIDALASLVRQKLSRKSQLLSLKRSQSDLHGQIGEHRTEFARLNNSIRDAELELVSIDHQVREEAAQGLRDANNTIWELRQQTLTTNIQKARTSIRAPISGFVHELQVFTQGAVVAPGATVLQIISSEEGLEFETQVGPLFIDQVFVGQKVRVTFPGFAGANTPEAEGRVSNISADIVEDQRTGTSYYRVMLDVPKKELQKLKSVELVPGMPVEAFIQTGDRSILSYVTKPLMQHFDRMFRE